MSEKTDVEKRVEPIINDLEIYRKDTIALKKLKEQLDITFPKTEEREDNSGWEALKLFFFSIVGGVAGVLISSVENSYVANSPNWWILLIFAVAIPLVFSFIFYYVIYPFRKWRRKK